MLYPQKRSLAPESWSGHLEEERNLLPLLGFKPQIV
jgi:hypothetical protein